MSVRIRLARGGTKKRPFYRIVATNSRSPRDGRFLEKLGSYNPLLASDHPQRVVMNEERLRYWLARGATPSERVARFLDGAGITENTVLWRPAPARRPSRSRPRRPPRGRGRERLGFRARSASCSKHRAWSIGRSFEVGLRGQRGRRARRPRRAQATRLHRATRRRRRLWTGSRPARPPSLPTAGDRPRARRRSGSHRRHRRPERGRGSARHAALRATRGVARRPIRTSSIAPISRD